MDDAIQNAMGRLLDPLDLDRCAVFLLSDDGQDLRLTHHRTRAGLPEPPVRGVRQGRVPVDHVADPRGKMAYVRSLDEVPNETDRESLRRCGVTSCVAFPLTDRRRRRWRGQLLLEAAAGLRRPGILERLCLVAHVFGSALGRKRADARSSRASNASRRSPTRRR